MRRWMLLVLLAEAACGTKSAGVAPVDPCDVDHIVCPPLEFCDNRDEVCKCGPRENGLACPPGSACTPQGTSEGGSVFTCVSTLCDLVLCERGQSCNPTTGQCGCGEGESARSCSDAETCENGRCTPVACQNVTCRGEAICNPDDGICKCRGEECAPGTICRAGACAPDGCGTGAACADGQYCKDGTYCAPDPCYGATCPTFTKCNRDDSLCHCIGADASRPPDGPICTDFQTCIDVEGSGRCTDVECANINCPSGTVCDPTSGGDVCRCGGLGPDHPICGPDQACDLATGTCVGGHLCQGVKCDLNFPGTSCDEEDGFCKCGGPGGSRCHIGDVCLPVSGTLTCVAGCDPLADTCSGGDACYFDPVKNLAACLPHGFVPVGATCKDPTDCVAHSTCATQSGDGKTCVAYCDRTKNGADCPAKALCIGLDQTPGSNLGQCYTF